MLKRIRSLIAPLNFGGLPLGCFLTWPHSLHRVIKEVKRGDRVLDIGCGDGLLLKAINHYKGSVCFGIDAKDIEEMETVKFFKVDITKDRFPFDDNTFDCVLMNHVLEHLPEVDHTLKEIRRVMKTGGVCYIETPNPRTVLLPSINFKVEQGMPFNFYDDCTHIRPYNEFALRGVLRPYLEPVRSGKSRNWFMVAISPLKILTGFLFANRRDIFIYMWQLVGGASYIVCRKENNHYE